MATMFIAPDGADAPAFDETPGTASVRRWPQGVADRTEPPSRYGATSRRPLLLIVALVHAVLIFALIKLDVLHHHRPHRRTLVVMDIKPLDTPPPMAQPRPQPKQAAPKVETPIVAPPPIVSTPAPPPPVLASPAPPPPSPQPVAPAAPAAVTAPIVPPDGMAANLGNPGAKYPLESRRRHEEGVVRLRVVISVEGVVQEISVARSSGFERLDKAALEAVRRWRFKPGTQAGKPVDAVGFVPITFALTR